jgi:hypothetical protein
MSDPLRRAIRTLLWTFLGLYLTRLIGFLNALSQWAGCREGGGGADVCAFPDVGMLAYGLVAAGSAAVVAAVALVVNSLEDNVDWFPALLKAPASDGTKPIPDPTTD